jgi:hypothetical protein
MKILSLKEILNTIHDENESGLVPLDDLNTWNWSDQDYLANMGFSQDGDYKMTMKNPSLSVYLKRGQGYVVEDNDEKKTQIFKTFHQLIDYFDNYQQELGI